MRISRHANTVIVQAPAKLNLFLEIFSRRSDGYHELETLMVAINIYDTLVFTPRSGREVHLSCGWSPGLESRRCAARGAASPWEAIPHGGDNLVLKAIERLREHAGVEMAATINLGKRIPAAAGLGGASSDAAAALAAANAAWNLNWPVERLAEVAAELGSDIPFFLYGGAAVCRGRGEKIEPLGAMPRLDVVVVRPPAGLSTADVYRQCRPADPPRRADEVTQAWQQGRHAWLGRLLHNRLQPAAEQLSPWIARLKQLFQRLDVLGHQMSGSGSSYFALCRNARHARLIAGRLRMLGVGAVYCAASERSRTLGLV